MIARGVYPAVLRDQGPASALDEVAADLPRPVRLTGNLGGRLDWEIESGIYYVVAAAMGCWPGARPSTSCRCTWNAPRAGWSRGSRTRYRPMSPSSCGPGWPTRCERLAALGGDLEMTGPDAPGPADAAGVAAGPPRAGRGEQRRGGAEGVVTGTGRRAGRRPRRLARRRRLLLLLTACTRGVARRARVGAVVAAAAHLPSAAAGLDRPAGAGNRWAAAVLAAAPASEPVGQLVLDYGFSMISISLAVALLAARERTWSIRLFALAMIGSAGAFNLQAHAAATAVETASGLAIGVLHQVLLPGVACAAYILALTVFPSAGDPDRAGLARRRAGHRGRRHAAAGRRRVPRCCRRP